MKKNIGPIDRISIRDARYVYGRHVVDLASVEPVSVYREGKISAYWLCWANGQYIFEPHMRLSTRRDDGTMRPCVSIMGELLNTQPLKLVA